MVMIFEYYLLNLFSLIISNYNFQTILELSKLHMFRFHYMIMKPAFRNKIEVCFMDTDSFLYQIYCDNLEEKLKELSLFFDFSNYPSNHPLYSIANKNRPGR